MIIMTMDMITVMLLLMLMESTRTILMPMIIMIMTTIMRICTVSSCTFWLTASAV